ncbi:Frt2p KNAG_0D04900 [Huiozyma naganishii CBS 8797]|uniref:Uncharacterized protein n=1 Tax=Huiozyma naganishii (strain ATCC MYA-139 / BCRC 22969 / CBS 8797 / KCTC 17520 / NBRC 10181 / NCYC 3082 / Yp74L-3) TaxID=1071383 RepID=J7S667_HUIN7|nr:hypothetical protein KNAG_0D04900 [Kazachstania naganishii CBS 8797]CCK70229.1 hypothetical protein KNAG_0D04900 [Kazachstania naganishii CBS 8797]
MDLLVKRMEDKRSMMGKYMQSGNAGTTGDGNCGLRKPARSKAEVPRIMVTKPKESKPLDFHFDSCIGNERFKKSQLQRKEKEEKDIIVGSTPKPHVRNIFTALLDQERKLERETQHRRKEHHRHRSITGHGQNGHTHAHMVGRPRSKSEPKDYTSAATGTFSNAMFTPKKETNTSDSCSCSSSNESDGAGAGAEEPVDGHDPTKEQVEKDKRSQTNTVGGGSANAKTNDIPNFIGITKMMEPRKRHRKHHHGGDETEENLFARDNKRLVNQFLKSMAPPSSSQLQKQGLSYLGDVPSLSLQAAALDDDSNSSSQRSLQSLLYHDLEESPDHTNSSSFLASRYSSSFYSNDISSEESSASESASDESSTSSRSSFSEGFTTHGATFSSKTSASSGGHILHNKHLGKTNTNALQISDPEYLQKHVTLLLTRFDLLMKDILKGTLLKRETLQRICSRLIPCTKDLKVLRKQVLTLHDEIASDKLLKLRGDFDELDPQSFIAHLRCTVSHNATQLKNLEERMECCQQLLVKQKDEMKKIESMMYLEKTLLETEQSEGVFHRYRYLLFDITTLAVVVALLFLGRKLVLSWN